MVAMAACFACSDTLIKYLGAFVPVVLLLWVRYAVQAGTMVLWLAPPGRAAFASGHPKFPWGGGPLVPFTSGRGVFGLRDMPGGGFTAPGMLTPGVVARLVPLGLEWDE